MSHIRAKDVTEAVAIATALKRQGKHDWFRGQLQNWPVCPSALRLTDEQRERALGKLGRFEHWIRRTPGLERVLESPDSFFAVAQHYGLPTNYVDFTTSPEVAGFFAADNHGGHPVTRDSCIICLNTADLRRFWRSLPANYPPPEFIEIDVGNLWRLQAQEGCFLFCQYGNLEHFYDFDRILFPYTGALTSLPRERIYPKEKSALEILLDQFMMTERMAEGDATIRAMPAMRNVLVVRVDEDCDGVDPDMLARDLTPHPSWSAEALQPWLRHDAEQYHETVRDEVREIRVTRQLLTDRTVGRAHVLSLIGSGEVLRRVSVRWRVSCEPVLDVPNVEALAESLGHVWDGVRRLPYSNDQIADAIVHTVALWLESNGGRGYSVDRGLPAARRCFGEVTEVEFGAADGSYSRSYVSQGLLAAAIRPDIGQYLAPKWADQLLAHPVSLIQVIRKANLLFDFLGLADVVVRQVIPFQIVFRRRNVAVFFSPARLDRLGLP